MTKTIEQTINSAAPSQLKKLSTAAALAFVMLFAVACAPEAELSDVEAEVDVPTEQADVPDSADVGGEDAAINELIGETVTVSTELTEVLSPNLFTVYDAESLRGEELLAITDLPIPEPGTNVEVTGDIMELDEAAIKSAYNITLDPEVLEAYAGKPYLAVKGLETID